MNKLRVKNPFFTLEVGDILEPTQDGESYTAEHNEEFNRDSVDGGTYKSSLKSTFTISKDYASELISEDYLEEVKDAQTKFVNIFDEIDGLIKSYSAELDNIDAEKDSVPMCVKVEKTTVLSNLIKVLTHLKNLKK